MSTLYYTCRDGDSVKTVWVQQQLVAPALQFALWASSGIGCESAMGDLATADGVITNVWVWLGERERGEKKSEAVHFATVSLTLAHTPTHTRTSPLSASISASPSGRYGVTRSAASQHAGRGYVPLATAASSAGRLSIISWSMARVGGALWCS
jgi:hypothetical protein